MIFGKGYIQNSPDLVAENGRMIISEDYITINGCRRADQDGNLLNGWLTPNTFSWSCPRFWIDGVEVAWKSFDGKYHIDFLDIHLEFETEEEMKSSIPRLEKLKTFE